MRRFLCTVAATMALGATPALAVDFDTWDADDDSFIDRGEFETAFDDAGVFDAFDADADATLGTDEITDVSYAMMDLDGDGEVAVSEWDTWVDRNRGEADVNLSAAEWDQNGDDVISRAEFDAEVAERGRFAPFEAGEDNVYDADEFETGVFEGLDWDEDERLAEDEFLIDNFGI